MIVETIPALSALSSDDKILLAAELWQDAIGNDVGTPDPILVEALRERLDYFHNHPGEGSTWEEVRCRLQSGRNR